VSYVCLQDAIGEETIFFSTNEKPFKYSVLHRQSLLAMYTLLGNQSTYLGWNVKCPLMVLARQITRAEEGKPMLVKALW